MSAARTSSLAALSPSTSFRIPNRDEIDEKKAWTGVNLEELELDILKQPDEEGASPLLPDPDPTVPRELVDPPGGSIRFAAVKKCPQPVNAALAAGAGGIVGGMVGGVTGVVVKQAAELTGEAAGAALGGSVAAGMLLGTAIAFVLTMWEEYR